MGAASQVAYNEAKAFFTEDNPYVFERLAGNGIAGAVVQFIHKQLRVRYAAKRWFGGHNPRYRETRALQLLKSSEHVVGIKTIANNPFQGSQWVIMEFIAGGNMLEFVEILEEEGNQVPNRVWWSVFLCLARVGVAMAWPPKGPSPSSTSDCIPPPEQLETEAEPDSLIHGDLHNKNVMIGEFDPWREEHTLVPIMKVIDWDQARDYTSTESFTSDAMANFDAARGLDELQGATGKRNPATDKNVLDIGIFMANMLFPTEDGRFCKDGRDRRERLNNYYDPDDENNDYYTPDEEYYDEDEDGEFECGDDYADDMSICDTSGDFESKQSAVDIVELDEDLVKLVARCLAVNPAYRPSLEELVQDLENFVLRVKTQDHYRGTRNEAAESDQNVTRVMRQGWMDATSGLKLQTTDDFGLVPWVRRTRVLRRIRSFNILPEQHNEAA